MADIIINGPEGQSTINNIPAWATEATQKTIADSLKGIGSSADKIEALLQLQSKGIKQLVKTGKEGDKELADLFERVNKDNNKHATSQTKQSKAATDTINNGLDQLTKIQSDGVNQLSQLNKETAQQNKDLDKILDQLNDSGSGLMSFASGGSKIFGALGLVLDGLIGGIKILGGVILSVASYIGKEFMDTFNILNNSLKQGTGGIIGLTQGVDNVATAANLAGMSLEEFADFAAANSKILRTLSASGFADLYSKTLLASNGLLDLGMTADDAVESVMNELEYRRRFGIVLSQSTLELQSGLIRSARELRVFANAVGISEADLRQQAEIQEQHIDLMAGQAKAMGKNESEMENMINAAQRTSRVLAAIGGEDLINPLFESISKGATGLSDEFVEMVAKHEGVVLEPYRDILGISTIGIGRNLEDGGITDVELNYIGKTLEDILEQGLTREEAYYLCRNDISNVEKELLERKPVVNQLDSVRQMCLVDMGFNMGVPRLMKFVKMWGAIEVGDFYEASEQMLDSRWATQVGKRSEDLAEMMKLGYEFYGR